MVDNSNHNNNSDEMMMIPEKQIVVYIRPRIIHTGYICTVIHCMQI